MQPRRPEATVTVRDVEAISRVAREWQAEVVALADDGDPGLVVTSADGRIEVDARLSVRLERGRTLLAEAVARLLDLEPVESAQGTVS